MSPKLPILKPKQVVSGLKKADFYEHHQTGSHLQLRHRDKFSLRVTVPMHGKTIKQAVLRAILKQADLSIEKFSKLL